MFCALYTFTFGVNTYRARVSRNKKKECKQSLLELKTYYRL